MHPYELGYNPETFDITLGIETGFYDRHVRNSPVKSLTDPHHSEDRVWISVSLTHLEQFFRVVWRHPEEDGSEDQPIRLEGVQLTTLRQFGGIEVSLSPSITSGIAHLTDEDRREVALLMHRAYTVHKGRDEPYSSLFRIQLLPAARMGEPSRFSIYCGWDQCTLDPDIRHTSDGLPYCTLSSHNADHAYQIIPLLVAVVALCDILTDKP